jgi:hypothetical protein
MTSLRKVDQNGLKVGQALTIILLLLAFVLGESAWPLVAFVAIAQLFGGLGLPYAPYKLIYQFMVQKTGLIKPKVITDNPEPHQFSMLLGAIFNGLATLALLLHSSVLGWALVWIVIALANLNFWLNFCVGCWVYYQLNRLGLPYFSVSPIKEN